MLSHAIQFLSKAIPPRRRRRSPPRRREPVLHAKPSVERLIASRVTPSPSASVEMSQVACRASYATAGSLARSFVTGRHARLGQAREEAAAPRGSVVGRHGEADVGRGALEAPPDLEGGHGRAAEREAVGLDLGLVLAAVVAIRVAREPAPDELAVARDCIEQIGVHDVGTGAAAHRVTAPVVRRETAIRSRPAVERVAAAAAVEEVGAASAEEQVASSEAADRVGARRSDEAVVPGRARDGPRAGGAARRERRRVRRG